MFRKFIMALAICFMATAARAEVSITGIAGKLKDLPLKQGIAYSLQDNKINYLSTVELAKWKGFSLEAGYAGRAENTGDKAVAVVSCQLAKAKDLGVTLPIWDLLEANVGVYAGYGRIDRDSAEFDWGASLTLVQLRF